MPALQDVIVHVRDISHPDAVAQKANVLQTLQRQNIDSKLLDNMIEVCNKVDKLGSRLSQLHMLCQFTYLTRCPVFGS